VSIIVRPARSGDVAAMSRVLIASITQLCAADHEDDPQRIAEWTSNKSPEGVAAMLAQDGLFLFVAEQDGRVAAVGATTANGGIALNYVDPEARFKGLSKALLAAMEADLLSRGFALGRLEATKTARAFYLSQGWLEDEQPSKGRAACRAMHKRLGAAG
jgi:GNAT superfamily N-acetyltransferase